MAMESPVSSFLECRTILLRQLEFEYAKKRVSRMEPIQQKQTTVKSQTRRPLLSGEHCSAQNGQKVSVGHVTHLRVSTPRRSISMKSQTSSTSDIIELRNRLDQIEIDRSIFMQEGVFDLIKNVIGDAEGRAATSPTPELAELIRANGMLSQRIVDCEDALENAKNLLHSIHAPTLGV